MKTLLSILILAGISAAVYYYFFCPPGTLPTLPTLPTPSPTPNPMVALRGAADAAIEEICSPLSRSQNTVALSHFKSEIQGIDSKIYAKQKDAAIRLSVLLQQAELARVEFSKRLQNNEANTKPSKLNSGSAVEDREMRLKHFDNAIRKQWEIRALQLRTAIQETRLRMDHL